MLILVNDLNLNMLDIILIPKKEHDYTRGFIHNSKKKIKSYFIREAEIFLKSSIKI